MDEEKTHLDHNHLDESSFTRPDSLKSSSLLKLGDVVCQSILLHPFVALRRTCQVNRKCSPLICAQPFSLIPFVFHQQRKQGLFALYRGLTSELLVKGIVLGTETTVANYLEWPTELKRPRRYIEDSLKVLALRGISIALATPFLCSAVIQTVQSVIILRDRPSFVDCLKDGLLRLIHLRYNPSSRMLPIWMLILPTVTYHIAHKVILHAALKFIDWFKVNIMTEHCHKKRNTQNKSRLYGDDSMDRNLNSSVNRSSVWQSEYDLTNTRYESFISATATDKLEEDSNTISSTILASLVADVALLPAETVMNSIYIQGTRTIIDNCDETTVVLPVLTNYDGFSDCFQSIIRFESHLGLYKGLGAIVLQYTMHYIVFKSLYLLLKEIQKHSDEDR